jgi:hypothetical protein
MTLRSVYIKTLHDDYAKEINSYNQCIIILTSWIMDVIEDYSVSDDNNRSMCIACYIIDFVMSKMFIPRNKLQLYGTAALVIASKYECDYEHDLSMSKAVQYTDNAFTKKELCEAEKEILIMMDYKLPHIMAYDLIFQYYIPSTLDPYDDNIIKISTYVFNILLRIYKGQRRLKYKYMVILSLLIAINMLKVDYPLPYISHNIYSSLAYMELRLSKILRTEYKNKGKYSYMTDGLMRMLMRYTRDMDGITLNLSRVYAD